MMPIYLYNTLTGLKEEFKPLKKGILGFKKVSMYHCGPTVYNYPHVGNLRAYIFADTLKRLMLASGYGVNQVINITDVGHLVSNADTGEDRMEKAAKRENKTAKEISKFYTDVFMDNIKALNIDIKGTEFPKATEFIKEQITIIQKLEKKGFTYKTSDGIYFDTSKFPEYGKLGNINLSGIREGERVEKNNEKKNATDFALWKFSPREEKREQEWSSPWGIGFPGWHIECSAMSMAYLGETFDIHTGGIDHIPVHHQNEIAQSEGATGKRFVRYWMHSAFVNIDGNKMAKSKENFLTLNSIIEKGYSPMDYRYLLLGARYSTPLNFTWEALDASRNANQKLDGAISELPNGGRVDKNLWEKALGFVSDDLDTPKVLALEWDILKNNSVSPANKKATILKIDKLLGFTRTSKSIDAIKIPSEIAVLLEKRKNARLTDNWKESDKIRAKIQSMGFDISDTPTGQEIKKR